MDELETCLAFIRTLDERCAERTVRGRFGTAHLCESLPRVYSLNFHSLDRGVGAPVEELVAEADRLLGTTGVGHRKIVTDDDALGVRLVEPLRGLGWRAQPLFVMVDRACDREADGHVSEVSCEALVPVWEHGMHEQAEFDDELVRQVVTQRRVIGAAGSARYFAVLVDAAVVSYCELYTDGRTGQIEGVLTVPEHRNRGLASAVVTTAAVESRRQGHALTFLLAEEDDWPKELYRKLGFEPVGRIWDFLLAA